ncbi:MAG: hypothetical protein WC091_06940 [Sulfuricellaceae bacterium]
MTTAINAAIQELNSTINSLSRFPETDKSATAALLSSTTAREHLRDALKAATPADAPAIATPTGEPCTFSLMSELWERAAPSLDRESLVWFAGAIDQAENVAVKLQGTVEGIGCLIGFETDGASQTKAGDFQSGNDTPALLFAIAHAIDNIRALILVGDSASHRLWRPELYR